MKLENKRVVLTGAASGIGRCVALQLATEGCDLVLVDRDRTPLLELSDQLRETGAEVEPVTHDLGELASLAKLWDDIARKGAPDVLINNAGLMSFCPVESESPEGLELLFRVNVVAPLLLCRAAVPAFRERGSGQIVNVGSIFGSIAFAYFASYSASKFAVRGYSEALRRELAGSGVRVTYVAPRATRTRLANQFGAFAEKVGMNMDEPERVAQRIVRAVRAGARERYLGFPECLFVRVNALLPRLVDRALRRQDEVARSFAEASAKAVKEAA